VRHTRQLQRWRKLNLPVRTITNTMMNLPRILFLLSASASLAVIAGCGGTVNDTGGGGSNSCTQATGSATPPLCPARIPVAGVSFAGKVSAGLLPVSGASVQLYAAGITGNGSAPSALLATTMSTNGAGAFTVPSGYICPSAQTPSISSPRAASRAGRPRPINHFG
jgi:hypothetical protein